MDDYSNPYQQNDQWFADRCGCLTASRAAAVINVSKRDGQPLKSYFDLINTIVSERVTGIVDVTPTTSAMQWGIDNEEEARKTYTLMTGREVELVDFVRHPSIEWFGASPDGLVGSDGLIEIKCPNTATPCAASLRMLFHLSTFHRCSCSVYALADVGWTLWTMTRD